MADLMLLESLWACVERFGAVDAVHSGATPAVLFDQLVPCSSRELYLNVSHGSYMPLRFLFDSYQECLRPRP